MYREVDGRRAETGQQWAEVNFVPDWIGHSKNSPEYRYIAIREPLRNPPLLGMAGQRELWSHIVEMSGGGGWYKVFGIVTNRDLDPQELVWWYRQRCGKGEEVYAVLKEDLAGGRLPSGLFGANAAWWAITTLAFNLNSAMKQLALGQEWVSRRLKAVRFGVINLPGRVVRHARKLVINRAEATLHTRCWARRGEESWRWPRGRRGADRPWQAQRPLKPGPAGRRRMVCGLSPPGIAAHTPLAPSICPKPPVPNLRTVHKPLPSAKSHPSTPPRLFRWWIWGEPGVRQSFGGLSGAADRSAAPGVIGGRPARGFWRFPSAGDPNLRGAFHRNLRRRLRAGIAPGLPNLRVLALLWGRPGSPQRWSSAAAELRPEPSGYPGPFPSPPVAAYNVPQAQHRIRAGPRPVHPPALQPRFNHQLVGALHGPAADGPALSLKDWGTASGLPAFPGKPDSGSVRHSPLPEPESSGPAIPGRPPPL